MKKLTVTIELEEQAGETYDNETYADIIKEAIECNTTAFVYEVNIKSKKI